MTLTAPAARAFSYTLDEVGRVEALTDWLDNTTTFGWDANGNLIEQVAPNGVMTSKVYNYADEVTNIAYEGPSSTLAEWDYTRNANGYVTGVDPGSVNPNAAETYGYTQRDQMQRIDNIPLYGYDAADNLTAQVIYTRGYNEANQLTDQLNLLDQSTTEYAYDANGNRTLTDPGPSLDRIHTYDQGDCRACG